MAEIGQLKIGDRVTLAAQEGVFFVLHVDLESLTASLLPGGRGPALDKIPVETLTFLSAPEG